MLNKIGISMDEHSEKFNKLAGGFFITVRTKVFGESLKENEEHTGN